MVLKCKGLENPTPKRSILEHNAANGETYFCGQEPHADDLGDAHCTLNCTLDLVKFQNHLNKKTPLNCLDCSKARQQHFWAISLSGECWLHDSLAKLLGHEVLCGQSDYDS